MGPCRMPRSSRTVSGVLPPGCATDQGADGRSAPNCDADPLEALAGAIVRLLAATGVDGGGAVTASAVDRSKMDSGSIWIGARGGPDNKTTSVEWCWAADRPETGAASTARLKGRAIAPSSIVAGKASRKIRSSRANTVESGCLVTLAAGFGERERATFVALPPPEPSAKTTPEPTGCRSADASACGRARFRPSET